MIKKLKIENFKSIKKIELEFNRFNVLCGENASGKTAIIHSILAVSQKYEKFSSGIDGEILKIGNYGEVHNYKIPQEHNVKIFITDDLNNDKNFSMNAESKIEFQHTSEEELNINFEKDIFYLSSNRIGVVDTYTKGSTKFGVDGLCFVDFVLKNRRENMPEEYINKFKNEVKLSIPVMDFLYEHFEYWFENITEEKISLKDIPNTNQYLLTFKKASNLVRSINTGSGFSYLLPIISMCLGALVINEGGTIPTIIIENPEIYLHPKAQEKLIKFLSFISNFAQIIIETHSDHILKATIEEVKDSKIFVFNLKTINGAAETNKEVETIQREMTSKNFKTNPISYAEVQYSAFGLITPELHIILYAQLHDKCVKLGKCGTSITSFDCYLTQIIPSSATVLKKPSSHKYKDSSGKQRTSKYNTLPTYIRNLIDHPDVAKQYSDAEMEASIEFLLSQL